MSQITVRIVQNIYVSYVKYTSDLYNLDLNPNRNSVEPQRAKYSKKRQIFLFSRHVFN
jgi:hypothetical protein